MELKGRPLPQYLVIAEQFMLKNKNQDITLNDIARAAGCSERAIVRIFQEYREMHPLTILATLRSFD